MSRVVETELLEGDADGAASADVNATLTSWNAATAAGSINGANVRQEGLDRRSLAAHSVYTQRAGAVGTNQFVSNTATGYLVSVPYVVLTMGGNPAQVGPTSALVAGDALVVRASIAFFVASNQFLQVHMEESVNGGAWAGVAGTAREFQVRALVNALVPECYRDYTIAFQGGSTAGNTYSYRVAFRIAGGGADFRDAVLNIECLAG